jgi:hypothetical protein
MASLLKRLKFVAVLFGLGLGLSAFLASLTVANAWDWWLSEPPHPVMLLLLFLGPAGGPFAEPLAFSDFSLLRICLLGGVLMLLIALHPCWPRSETGLVSGLAVEFWFLTGFAYIYAGV